MPASGSLLSLIKSRPDLSWKSMDRFTKTHRQQDARERTQVKHTADTLMVDGKWLLWTITHVALNPKRTSWSHGGGWGELQSQHICEAPSYSHHSPSTQTSFLVLFSPVRQKQMLQSGRIYLKAKVCPNLVILNPISIYIETLIKCLTVWLHSC